MAASVEKAKLTPGGQLKKPKLIKRELPSTEKAAHVDLLVFDCIEQLSLRGLEREGILRVSGSTELIKKLQQIYAKGRRVHLDNVDIHTVAGLLKAYFRDSSGLVLNESLYPTLLECTKPEKKEDQIQRFKDLVAQCSVAQQETLHKILVLISKVASKSEVNKMNITNLATMFSPILFSPKEQKPEDILKDHELLKATVIMFISEYRAIFEGWSDTQVAKDQNQDLDDKIAEWAGHRPGTKDFQKQIQSQEKKTAKLRAAKEAQKNKKIQKTLHAWAGPTTQRTSERTKKAFTLRRKSTKRTGAVSPVSGNSDDEEEQSTSDSPGTKKKKKKASRSLILQKRRQIKSFDQADAHQKNRAEHLDQLAVTDIKRAIASVETAFNILLVRQKYMTPQDKQQLEELIGKLQTRILKAGTKIEDTEQVESTAELPMSARGSRSATHIYADERKKAEPSGSCNSNSTASNNNSSNSKSISSPHLSAAANGGAIEGEGENLA